MTRRTPAIALPLLALAAATFLATAGPASAIYVYTPLHISVSAGHAEVGDELTFDISPSEETNASEYAGLTVTIHYAYDRNAPGHGDENSSSDVVTSELTTLTLDAKASGTFTWIVPAEVDDHNVFVSVRNGDGDALGDVHLAIGDAEPMFFATGGQKGGALESDENAETPLPEETDGTNDPAAQSGAAPTPSPTVEEKGDSAVPAAGLAGAVGALGAAALIVLVARRR